MGPHGQKHHFYVSTHNPHSDVILFPTASDQPVHEGGVVNHTLGCGGGNSHFWGGKTATFAGKTATFLRLKQHLFEAKAAPF